MLAAKQKVYTEIVQKTPELVQGHFAIILQKDRVWLRWSKSQVLAFVFWKKRVLFPASGGPLMLGRLQ